MYHAMLGQRLISLYTVVINNILKVVQLLATAEVEKQPNIYISVSSKRIEMFEICKSTLIFQYMVTHHSHSSERVDTPKV